jgi:hypothetical protein
MRTYTEYRDRWASVGAHAGYAFPVARLGLGSAILLAPAVWTNYAAPWVTPPGAPLSLETATVLNGAVETLFGVALLAGVTALSLAAVVFGLLTGAATTGAFVDILVHDVGLFVLAVRVTLCSADCDQTARSRE